MSRLSKYKLKSNIRYFWKKMFNMELTDYQHDIARCLRPRIAIAGGRRSGKTVLWSGESLRYAALHPNQDVAVFAPSWEIARIFMDTVRDMAHEGLLEHSIARELSFEIVLTNRSRVFARTLSRTSRTARGHGRRVGLLILDDAAFIPEECLKAVRPIRLDKKAKEVQMSTALGHNHFYRTFKSKKYASFKIKTEENPYIDKEELAVDRELMTELEYKQEYEAEFLDDEYAVFSEKLISDATNNDLPFIERPDFRKPLNIYAGLDLARKRDHAVLFIINLEKNHIRVFKIHMFPKTQSERFWDNLIDQTCELAKKFRIKRILTDQTGIGDKPVLDLRDRMAQRGIPCRVDGMIISKYTKQGLGLINELLLKFERREFHFPFHKEFIRQLKNIRKIMPRNPNKLSAVVTDYETIGHDDIVSAACLAVKACPRTTQFFYSKSGKTIEETKEETFGGRVVSTLFNA